eukprot:GHVS01098034.1.p1 GENE.GHVS01098034.1~~GHVS01098034.1.p1  ORF type:complete len:121 (+),score=14.68 GHVS01098034.1:113-475(+)
MADISYAVRFLMISLGTLLIVSLTFLVHLSSAHADVKVLDVAEIKEYFPSDKEFRERNTKVQVDNTTGVITVNMDDYAEWGLVVDVEQTADESVKVLILQGMNQDYVFMTPSTPKTMSAG